MMARTLSTLLGAGVPLIEAVDIVSGVMSNVYFKEALQDAKEEITIGMPLSRPLQESGMFPPMVYQMIRIGEESGNTEEMLDKLADYYEEEVEMAVQSVDGSVGTYDYYCIGGCSWWTDSCMHDAYDELCMRHWILCKKELSVLCRDRTIINKWGGKLTTLKLENT